jgi:hypothetical protein
MDIFVPHIASDPKALYTELDRDVYATATASAAQLVEKSFVDSVLTKGLSFLGTTVGCRRVFTGRSRV